MEALGIALERGAVVTDRQMRTNVPGVWAVGDCNGKLMLAHTAYREAEVAVNDMLGKKDAIDYSIIPSVIYTTPEVACVGETEQSAREKGLDVQVVKARWRSRAGILQKIRREPASASCSMTGKTAASWASIWSAPMYRRSSTARP